MQNFPNQTPAGGATPAKKPGLSKGCLIGIIAAAVLVAVGLTLILAAAGGLYYFNRQASSDANSSGGYTTTTSSSSSPSSSSSSSGDAAESPSPTSAQTAAVAGGQTALWEQQEISWTVPQRWKQQEAGSLSFQWRSPGSWDAASLIVNISPMDANFPADASIQSFYDGAQTRKQNGEVDEVRWLKLGGLRGFMFRESSPEGGDDPQRLQWLGYRNYKGQLQLVNIMLAARGKDFARHEDALYGILYTTTFKQ